MSSAYPNFADVSPSVKRKRKSAALSCAECRRLKLRCSRVFPCSNCVKRGCSAICPEGSLTTGKGNRFVLANTEVLHDKIGQLANRVRHLEDALAESHSALTSDAHPLLVPELLRIKNPLEREKDEPLSTHDGGKEATEVIDAIGSLSISDHGRAAFFGKTANSWYLLQNEEGDEEHDANDNHEIPMPSDIPWLSHAFPFASTTAKLAENTRGTLLSFLPRASTTRNIADMYYKHAAFLYTPIPESEFHESIFLRIYHPDLVPDNGPANSHRLAVLFMVLALGTLMDLDKPSHSQESKQYYQLGRAALSLDSVFEEQSIISIQALFLMCHFMFLSDIEGPRWALMGLVVKLAQGIGLHRDSGKWNLESEETQKRRTLMWEIYTYDSWQSLTFGRPPSFALAHIDCQMAYDTTRNEAGEVEMSFAAWKHRFSSQCLSTVQDQAFGARTPSYKTIQQLDRQVREFYLPPSLQVPGFGNSKIGKEVEQPSIQLTMQRYLAFAIREITLFYMHRGFFARAVEDHPDDPLGSKYAPSVLAAYSSACSFVGLIESLYSQHPAITERMWFLFTHVFSCAIVLGAIATKNQMALAPSALSHLESANHLFEQVSENPRASKIIPIIQNLRRRAQSAIVEDKGRIMDSFRVNYFGSIKNEIDKLSSLGGMTRLVSRRKNSSHPSPGNDNRGSQSPTSISPTVNRSSSLPLKESTPPSALETFSPWQQNFGHFHHSPHSTPSYPPVPSMHEQGMYNGHTDAHMTPQYFTTYNNPSPPGMEEWYSQSNMMPVQSPVDGYYPAADHLNASWQSFVAQYKPV